MVAYTSRLSLEPDACAFFFNDAQVAGASTPRSLGMEDGDRITVVHL